MQNIKGNTTTSDTFKSSKTIVLAGATGSLGKSIAAYLTKSGGTVKALVRKGSAASTTSLQYQGVQLIEVDYYNPAQLIEACSGASCLVSAVSGLQDVIVGVQTQLLHAAIEAGIPRFVPSDYCIDYTKLPKGSNRNLDLRRAFNEVLNKAPIKATSILNGMFMDLLTGQAPVILQGLKRVMYWGDANQPLDFTTANNTAAYTAAAALDPTTPRYLRIAGEVASINHLQKAATEVFGKLFKRLRLGGLGSFQTMIKITRTLAPQKNEVFPAWQGMQYLHNMFTGLPKLKPLDNDRYPNIRFTSIREVLSHSLA